MSSDTRTIQSASQPKPNDAPAVNAIFGAANTKCSLEAQSFFAARSVKPRETALPEAADLTSQQTVMSRMTGGSNLAPDTKSFHNEANTILNGPNGSNPFTIVGLDTNSAAKKTAFDTVMTAANDGNGIQAARDKTKQQAA